VPFNGTEMSAKHCSPLRSLLILIQLASSIILNAQSSRFAESIDDVFIMVNGNLLSKYALWYFSITKVIDSGQRLARQKRLMGEHNDDLLY
jgi:hypothetical protein